MKGVIGFKSVRSRLAFWFLMVALVPLMTVFVVIYEQRVDTLRETTISKLTAVRNLKVNRVYWWLNEVSADVRNLADLREIRKPLETLTADGAQAETAGALIDEVNEHLNRYVMNDVSFREIFVVSSHTGKIIYASKRERLGEDRSKEVYFVEPTRTQRMYIQDIHLSDTHHEPAMVLSMPVLSTEKHKESHIEGILVAYLDLKNSLYKLLEDRTGMGETGETLIANKDIIALSELRWHKDAPLKLKLSGRPAHLAVMGETGTVEAIDYRGKEVLAAYTYIPPTQWGFVAKQDMKEVYAPVRSILLQMALLFLSSFVVVGVISLLVSGNIARPMVEMAAVSRKIESGDLSARQTVSSDDELGYLAQSLDGMAESIQKQMVALESIAELNKVIAGASSLDTFYDNLLQKLMDLTGSVLGVCFVTDTEEADIFELRSAVGISPERLDPFDPGGLDGELRKALMSGQICRIAQIPHDTPFTFRTFAGMAVPRDILTIPVRTDGHVAMVLSIASLHDYSDHHISIIEHTWPVMGTALSNLLGIEATRRLTKKLHAQNLELETQAEQLQVQTEELHQQSEELQQQTEELQQQNIDLEAQSRQVEEANRLKSEFLSNMSHELRTPLNSVMALSKVLIMQARNKLSGEEISYLEIIERNGRKLLSLINDILDLSKIEAGRIELKPKKLSLRLVLGDIMERLQPMAEVKGVELIGDIPDDLPLIESDEARVDQIFQNLIGNAIKFTEKGSVRVTAFSDPDRVYVHVSDTGIGIPSEQMQRVFDEFHQVDGSSSRRYEGTGLGLAIVKKATGLLGGQVLVESTLGSGTTFRVSLPIWWQGETTREAEPASAAPPDRFDAVHTAPGRKSVLVVDDDPKTVALISQYLQEEGYRALEAVSGATALNLAELYHPFAIVLDILMPDMDGFEVLQALKRNPKTADIPVIAISVKGDRRTGAALGAAGFIAKPVLKESLIGELKRASKPAPRMLIVEDNDAAIIQIKSMLEHEGYPVDIAQGGKQAMDYLEHSVPDGIILDLMMPEVDGFEVLERIRSRQATAVTPVLVLTAKDLTMEDKNRLSLCNVQQVVHKGDVDIEELLMKVRLMLGRGSNPEAPAQTDASHSSGEAEMIPLEQPASIDTKKTREGLRTVLIIEDNPDNMITVKAILGGSHRLLEATDGETGLNMAMEQSPDLVLLDIALPGMDGFAVARKLRECESARCIPIIALTAKAMKGDRERILEAGCNDCVSKPINPEALLAKVDEWLLR